MSIRPPVTCGRRCSPVVERSTPARSLRSVQARDRRRMLLALARVWAYPLRLARRSWREFGRTTATARQCHRSRPRQRTGALGCGTRPGLVAPPVNPQRNHWRHCLAVSFVQRPVRGRWRFSRAGVRALLLFMHALQNTPACLVLVMCGRHSSLTFWLVRESRVTGQGEAIRRSRI